MVKKCVVEWRAGWTVRCGDEGEDGEMLSLLRPSRGRCASVDQPARLLVLHRGRGRAPDCSSSSSDALISCSLPPRSNSLTRTASHLFSRLFYPSNTSRGCACHISLSSPLTVHPPSIDGCLLKPLRLPAARPRCQSCLPLPVPLRPRSMGPRLS